MKLLLVLPVLLLASCALEEAELSGEPVVEISGKADGLAVSGVTLVELTADWRITPSAPIVGTGQVRIRYDLARLPNCRARKYGLPAWDIVLYWRIDGGPVSSIPVTRLVNADREPFEPVFTLPAGRDLEMWFHSSDVAGCSEWDSNYGRNHHLRIEPPTAHLARFAADWTQTVSGVPSTELVVDYDLRRLPACRASYNGYATWYVRVYASFDGGEPQTAELTQVIGEGTRWQAPGRLSVPEGARSAQLWFEAGDRSGCHAWDSAYGQNYLVRF
jgi:hypothetical protein